MYLEEKINLNYYINLPYTEKNRKDSYKEINFFQKKGDKINYLICQNQQTTEIDLSNLLENELSHDQINRLELFQN